MISAKHLVVYLSILTYTGLSNAATEHPDGSLTLTPEEYKQTLANFNMLINAVNHLKEQLRIVEEMKQCKGV